MPRSENDPATRAPLLLNSKPGQPVGEVSASRYGQHFLIAAAASKTPQGQLHLWSLPISADAEFMHSSASNKPSQTLNFQNRIMFNKILPDGKALVTLSTGESLVYQARFVDSQRGLRLVEVASNVPFDVNPTETLSFNLSSASSSISSNETTVALIDSNYSGRVSVLGLVSSQQTQLELIQDFHYAPIIGNLATAAAVRCSSAGGSPLLVIGDITGRLHFFDLRLANTGVPIFTKAGAVKPISCIGLHPLSTETVIFGCEDGAMSMIDLRAVSAESTSSAAAHTGFAAHTLQVNALAFNSSEPDQIFSVGSDGLLLEWMWNQQQMADAPSAEPVFSLPGISINSVTVDSSRSNTEPTVIAGSDLGDIIVIS